MDEAGGRWLELACAGKALLLSPAPLAPHRRRCSAPPTARCCAATGWRRWASSTSRWLTTLMCWVRGGGTVPHQLLLQGVGVDWARRAHSPPSVPCPSRHGPADGRQISFALQQGLLPETVPRSWEPTPEPRPLKCVRTQPPAASPCTDGLLPVAVGKPLPSAAPTDCSAIAPPLPAPVARRASTTPRPAPLLEDAGAGFMV